MRLRICVLIFAVAVARLGLPAPVAAAPVPDGTIEAIDKIAAESIEQKKVASYAVGVVKDGALVLARGYGFADLENDVPATAETVYRLGSITKQFTSMSIMQLAEQGKLSIDDELTRFLPDYPTAGHKVTVHHLLNHTSGIKSYTSTLGFFQKARQDLSHDDMLAIFKDKPFDFEPGTKWRYNNSGYYLLGMIIEKASGENYAQYLNSHIFAPLGMSATRYGDTRPLVRHRAAGYKLMLGQLINDDPISMTAPGAAGALMSNVLDMVKWHMALERGDFIGSASYAALYEPTKLADGSTQPYGYGWGVGKLEGHRFLSHGGGINGFSTEFARYPDDRLAVIVLSNTAGANVGKVANQIAKRILKIEDKPIADLPTDAELIARLTGKYKLGENEVEILADEGKLYSKRPGRSRERLKYQGSGQFVPAENEEVRITFTPADGQAQSFELEARGQKQSAQRAQ